MCCFIIWILFDCFSTWVKQMLMTAVFLMYFGEMLSKKCSVQGEWSGQPNIAGSGQSKSTASIHCLASAPAIMKCEYRAVRMWKFMKEQGQLDKWDSDFPPVLATDRGVEFSAVSMWPSCYSTPCTSSLGHVDSAGKDGHLYWKSASGSGLFGI